MINDDDKQLAEHWMGKTVRQISVTDLAYQHNIGRTSKVVETMWDENGRLHVRTEDGFWCPAALMKIIR